MLASLPLHIDTKNGVRETVKLLELSYSWTLEHTFSLEKEICPNTQRPKEGKILSSEELYIGVFSSKAQRGFWQETIFWLESKNIVEGTSEGKKDLLR